MKNIASAGILASALLASIATTSVGATTFTTTAQSTAPTQDFALQNDIHATTLGANGLGWSNESATKYRHLGQIFTVGGEGFTLDKISLRIHTVFGGNAVTQASFTLSFYEFAGPQGKGAITPTATLFTATSVMPSTGLANGAYLTFDVPDTLLEKNKTYGFVLSFDDPAANRSILFSFNNSGGNQTGTLRIHPTETNGDLWVYDNNLRFGLVATTSQIPEPSTFALAAGGLVLGLSIALRRKTRR